MTTDNQRLLQYFLYGLGLVLAYIVDRSLYSLAMVIDQFFYPIMTFEVPLLGSLRFLFPILALAIGLGAAELARRNPKSNKYGVEVVAELRKVTWPSYKDVRGTTLVVFGVTLVISVILFVFDKIFDGLISLMLRVI